MTKLFGLGSGNDIDVCGDERHVQSVRELVTKSFVIVRLRSEPMV